MENLFKIIDILSYFLYVHNNKKYFIIKIRYFFNEMGICMGNRGIHLLCIVLFIPI